VTKTNKQKHSHFFVYSRRTTHDILGMVVDEVRTIIETLTFLIRSVVSSLGAIKNLWENAPTEENAYNLVVCHPKVTKLKTQKLPVDAYK